MPFDHIRIILVATSHPGNIGATARAMKTMGLTKLYLVTPKLFPAQQATELAAGADDILHNAIVTDTLPQALQGCQLIFATSARPRDIAIPGLLPAACASLINEQSDHTEVAIVFGREHAGLTNAELLHCHYHVQIPTIETFSSLNLSQAVQILAYEIRIKQLTAEAKVTHRYDKLATHDQIEQFYQHLQEVLITIDFLKPANPKRLVQRIRRMFNRIQLEAMEINILRGILTQLTKALHE